MKTPVYIARHVEM